MRSKGDREVPKEGRLVVTRPLLELRRALRGDRRLRRAFWITDCARETKKKISTKLENPINAFNSVSQRTGERGSKIVWDAVRAPAGGALAAVTRPLKISPAV
ncbi:hypothetical protein EVAR_39467_1 [Eumeta japonica]|uniref:Uncharacterized protein n=1 Tax=Eumeta variegata TaxID=151549 RepID=A0A4C1W1U9_EUMVA|nr:hypothetical protein EVAR_39467_1 [Eumeta japonica]